MPLRARLQLVVARDAAFFPRERRINRSEQDLAVSGQESDFGFGADETAKASMVAAIEASVGPVLISRPGRPTQRRRKRRRRRVVWRRLRWIARETSRGPARCRRVASAARNRWSRRRRRAAARWPFPRSCARRTNSSSNNRSRRRPQRTVRRRARVVAGRRGRIVTGGTVRPWQKNPCFPRLASLALAIGCQNSPNRWLAIRETCRLNAPTNGNPRRRLPKVRQSFLTAEKRQQGARPRCNHHGRDGHCFKSGLLASA